MKLYLFFIAAASMVCSLPQDDHVAEIKAWQEKLDSAFTDPEESPLTGKQLRKFKGLEYFPIDPELRIVARFVRTPDQMPFTMPTTTERQPVYEKYGEAHFILYGKEMMLEIYQNHRLRETEEYRDYLFLPFTDQTNGFSSYGGGRYLDLKIPEGDTILIDFNKAYNPYCAYNEKYSCPIPPPQNDITAEIKAGVMAWDK